MSKALIAAVLGWASLLLPLAQAEQAQDLYKLLCSSCHGMDGSGSTPSGKKMGAVDLRSPEVQSLSDEDLFKTIAYGVGHKKYPHAFVRRGVASKQVADLVVFIRKFAVK